MGGSGNSATTTNNQAQYPAEFKPIAENAARYIMRLQNRLPLGQFAQAQPAQVVGLAPYQQAVANFAPNLLAPSWGLETLQNLGAPISQLASNAVGVGNQTDPFTRAMNAAISGGFGGGRQAFPGADFQAPPQMTVPQMNQVAPNSTIVGPNTSGLIESLIAQLSAPIPDQTPTITPTVIQPNLGAKPPTPAPVAPPPTPTPPSVPWWHSNSDYIGQRGR